MHYTDNLDLYSMDTGAWWSRCVHHTAPIRRLQSFRPQSNLSAPWLGYTLYQSWSTHRRSEKSSPKAPPSTVQCNTPPTCTQFSDTLVFCLFQEVPPKECGKCGVLVWRWFNLMGLNFFWFCSLDQYCFSQRKITIILIWQQACCTSPRHHI